MSLVVERFLICDNCHENFGVDNRHQTAGQHRKDAKKDGFEDEYYLIHPKGRRILNAS